MQIWKSLEKLSPVLFLLAGGLMVIFAAMLGVEAFTDTTTSSTVLGPAGYAIALIGLLGLYRKLADRTPWLVRAGMLFTAFGATAAIFITIALIGVNLGVLAEEPPAWFMIFIVLEGLGLLIGFLSLSVAILRSQTYKNNFGLLLLAPPILFLTMLITGIMSASGQTVLFILGSGQAVSLLAIGTILWKETTSNGETALPLASSQA